jgi:hypothetical protein
MTKLADMIGNICFESDHFIVVGGGKDLFDPELWYEVVRKNPGSQDYPEMVFLYGETALPLVKAVASWAVVQPHQVQVEQFLYHLTELGRFPVRADH